MSGATSATLNNEKTLKLEGNLKAHKHDGNMKMTIHLPNEDPMSVAGYYNHQDTSPGFGKCKCGLDIHYSKGKNVKLDMKMNRPNAEEMDMEFDVLTPVETAKHITLHLKGKVSV